MIRRGILACQPGFRLSLPALAAMLRQLIINQPICGRGGKAIAIENSMELC
jgi:hypothetical protein